MIIHPAHFVSLCSLSMLSPQGVCRVFDADADGFVPGEGVGAVLLKPLRRAIADGDDIWAVVKGSAVNAGGRTSGYTVPNPNAQAEVITEALTRAGVDPSTIGYVEAHGTGTALGDPIEMAGLRRVFDRPAPATGDWGTSSLAVGSVKANVGHLEAAAGIAGLTKVLLQLRHGAIAPCANLDSVSPRIDLGDRLELPRELRPWRADPTPRRAGVSSFGAGGANAHVVLEEYRPAAAVTESAQPADADQLFVLSARSPELLAQYAGDVAAALSDRLPAGTGLRELAHTSQVGRPAFRERVAVLCSDVPDLVARLTEIAKGETGPGTWRGTATPGRETTSAARAGNWADLARRWVDGERVDWAARWPRPPRVATFPGHPQQRRRIWWRPGTSPAASETSPAAPVTVSLRVLDDAVREHHVGGRRILPGAAAPQLVHAALPELSGAVRFTGLTWQRPLDLDTTDQVRVVTAEHRPAEPIPFTVTGPDGVGYVSGSVEHLSDPTLSAVTAPTPEEVGSPVAPAVVYARLTAGGVRHGTGLQVLQALWAGPGECLADLAAVPAPGQWLDPAVLDGALQALAVLDDTTGYLPTSLAELTCIRPLPVRCRVHARDVTPPGTTGSRTVDLDVFDGGEHVLALRGLRLTAVRGDATAPPATGRTEAPQATDVTGAAPPDALDIRYRRPRPVPAGPPEPGRPVRHVLLSCSDPRLRAELAAELGRRSITWGLAADEGPADAVLHVCPATATDLTEQLREGFETVLPLTARHLSAGPAPLRVLVAHHGDTATGRARPAYAAITALLRTLALEHSVFSGLTVHVDGDPAEHARLLVDELLGADQGEVRLTGTRREVVEYEEYAPEPAAPVVPTGPARTYLITGGAGRLGAAVARHLAVTHGADIVLCGRRPADAEVADTLRELTATGVEAMYHPADVGDRDQVRELITAIRRRFGSLHGVVHAAGVTRDALAVRKTLGEAAEVLAPKVWGAVHLDEATRDEPLDFLALFSSVAATTGNLGQADYTFANAFLDAFAEERTALHAAGLRPGRTVSMGWPLWADSGLAVHEASRTLMAQHSGMVPLPGADALRAFDAFLAGAEPRPGVVAYDPGFRRRARETGSASTTARAATTPPADASAARTGTVEQELRSLAAGFLMVSDDDVDLSTNLMELGFDSISLTELITQVNARYGLDLLPTVLFEAPTLEALADRLVRDHPEVGRAPAPATPAVTDPAPVPTTRQQAPRPDPEPAPAPPSAPDGTTAMPIAVIGMAGRFPGVENLTALWDVVAAGQDRVGPVPADRAELLADPRMRGVRAGFLDRVAEFDAAAFGISPREAGFMDPQQRHLLEVTWEALQDAGRRPGELAGTATGVFVGVATGDYNELMASQGGAEAHMATGVAHAVLANRVSHLLDLRGPSEALDTACSSSLVAVHHAVRALRHGDCDLAVAGGVNLTLSPALYATFTRAGMLSARGRCASFDDSADGYVRGEGVGAVVLKPLHRALEDGDPVRAVILGSAVNHGGRSPSLTAPNPQSQAQVVVDAVRAAGVDPRTIGYVQAHGTGTALGDPVEIEGLKQAYARLYEDWNLPAPTEPHLAVGSVKTNIGHLEAAAGIAGLLTTVLAMDNGLVPPNPHLREPNRHLRLDGTPLTLADGAARPWRPVPDETGRPVRRAGVSWFGFGGSNAHVVLQTGGLPNRETTPATADGPFVVPVSARDERTLTDYCARLADALDREPDLRPDQVAYTLQVGREELPHRLAVVASDRAGLVAALRDTTSHGVHRGVVTGRTAGGPTGVDPADLAAAWCAGHAIGWADLWPALPGRIPLPGPGFTRTAHWFPRAADQAPEGVAAGSAPTTPRRSADGRVLLTPVGPEDPLKRPPGPVAAPEPAVPGTLRTGPGADSLRERVATALGLPAEEIGDQDSLTALGLDSIMRVELVRWLHDRHGITVPTSELYEHDTLAGLRAYLDTAPPAPEPVTVVAAEAEPEPAQKPEPDLAAIVRTAVERAVDADLGPDGRFTDGALSSLDMLRSVRALETVLGTLPKTLLFDHPDCAALADHLVERFGTPAVARLAGTAPVPSTGSAPGPAAGPGASPSATTPTGPTALVVPRSGLAAHPELSRLVDEVEQRHGMEAGLAGVSIAPLLFFPSTRDGYLAIGRRGDSVLVWRYTGAPERFADAAGELLAYCDRTGLRLNLLSTEPLTDLAGTPMLATAFGVVQRLEDLGSFSLGGGRRSKLRYLVKRFGRHGDNRVEEYVSGSDPETDAAVADLVDRWSEGKQMVNAYVAEARELIRAGKLPERHRIFLTHRDDRLLSAIVLAALPAGERLPPGRRVLPPGHAARRTGVQPGRDRPAARGRGRRGAQLRRQFRRRGDVHAQPGGGRAPGPRRVALRRDLRRGQLPVQEEVRARRGAALPLPARHGPHGRRRPHHDDRQLGRERTRFRGRPRFRGRGRRRLRGGGPGRRPRRRGTGAGRPRTTRRPLPRHRPRPRRSQPRAAGPRPGGARPPHRLVVRAHRPLRHRSDGRPGRPRRGPAAGHDRAAGLAAAAPRVVDGVGTGRRAPDVPLLARPQGSGLAQRPLPDLAVRAGGGRTAPGPDPAAGRRAAGR
ncbi:SDR family NAD(P)-dependent oxidoreductase [Streptomyces hirsutus]